MNNLLKIRQLAAELQVLAKEEWGEEYLDCDCGHNDGANERYQEGVCRCDCFMCTDGWKLTEMLEIHEWEKQLLPIITSRNPLEGKK